MTACQTSSIYARLRNRTNFTMTNLYPLLVPFAPLITALITTIPGCKSAKFKLGKWILLAGFASAALVLWQLIQNPEPIPVVLFDTDWDIVPMAKLSIDRLAAVMMLVISGFGALLYHYSTRYLQQDAAHTRYQALLALAVGSLLFMVSSTDLITLFLFWQVLSWFLCLLSHNFAHLPTAQASFRTFIMLRLGDLSFLAGILLAFHLYGTVQLAPLFEAAALDQTSFAFFGISVAAPTLITLLIFVGAMSKSAQVPLHMWLPDSLYAPTPIHALLHAGIINAGGFLLNRLAPLYALSSTTLHVVLVIGLVTAILGTSMMLVQNDIKKTLGYSTIGQMGYMIMECGLGAFSLAVFHLIAHGLFKADIFLNCGKGIQEAREHPYEPETQSEGKANWFGAFVLSFVIPLAMMIGVHNLLGISFEEHQGLFVLLLFSWITASQAALTLFRIKTKFISKIAMLIVVGLVATAYFFAAEEFNRFLIPDHAVAESYLHAAELPNMVFLALVAVLTLSIALAWSLGLSSKSKAEGKASWLANIYLFLMNRLYLDGLALRLHQNLKQLGRMIDKSAVTLILFIVASAALAWQSQNPLVVIAVAAVVWGSAKALVQSKVPALLFYAGLAQYSIIGWRYLQDGMMSPELSSHLWSLTLVWIGLIFAWSRISVRYGDLSLNQIGGLLQTMPRFGLCFGLLIMAAVGLPPFSLFFSYLGILLSPSIGISCGLVLLILAWFTSCWYLFKLMQRLLFGQARLELRYRDIGAAEILFFLVIIALLLVPSAISQLWLTEVF